MTKKPLNILAINPGTKYLGYAVFHELGLSDWGIKIFCRKWSKEKAARAKMAIVHLIERFSINVLAIKKLNPAHSSENLNKLAGQIKEIARKRGLAVYQYSINDLKKFFSPEQRINKKQLAEIIASRYQSLFHELSSEQSHKNPYHIRMFEAVALGSICSQALDNHQ